MTNLHTLNEAFTELERRADAATASRPAALPSRPQRGRKPKAIGRLVPVAATVAVVAGLAVGAVLLAPADNGGTQVGAPPGETATAIPPPAATEPALPETPDELIERFQAVLGGTATVEVTHRGPGAAVMTAPRGQPDPSVWAIPAPDEPVYVGASIGGTLTAAGVTGGFDLVVYQTDDARADHCPDGDLGAGECTERNLPDGSRLIIGNSALEVPGGRTYGVDFQGADGTRISMHVSNLRDPKGPSGSPRLADQPPLTIEQMIAIVTSDLW